MTTARRDQFDPANPPWLHIISRCVRRAFLCGTDREGHNLDHRKEWVESRLRLLAQTSAVEVAGYAVMSNHLHVVLRVRPDQSREWTDQQVAERWLSLWPRERLSDGTSVLPKPAEVAKLAANTGLVSLWRARLADLGWCMKALKEDLSRRANREDECSGAFWEGRYRSVPLLDQAALTACMAYVDLNPIRARVADRPENSRFTGAYERIRVRQALRRAGSLRRSGDSEGARRVLAKAGLDGTAERQGEDRASWLAPVACCEIDGRPLSLEEYLTLLDVTGRMVREGKRGAIPSELLPILARLQIDVDRWLACMLGWRQFLGAAVGQMASRLAEAGRRGLNWVQNRCSLFAGDAKTEAIPA